MDDEDADTPEDGSDDDEVEDDDAENQDDQQSTSSESDEYKKSSSDTESSSEQETGQAITRSFTRLKRQVETKCDTPLQKCYRCGKILSTDFCLCVYKIPFQCERCNLTFAGLSEFQSHMRSVHTPNRINIGATNNIASKSATKEISQPSVFFNYSNAEPKFESEFLRTERLQEVHTCQTCKETFNTKLGLMAHSLNHTEREETNTYKCSHCNREFTSTVRLSIHVTRMHIEEKKFVCDVCNKGFRQEMKTSIQCLKKKTLVVKWLALLFYIWEVLIENTAK